MDVLQHALDTIDGNNGLAIIVAVLVSSALANVALLLGDRMLAGTLLPVVGNAWFLYWNYPRGLILAGDTGGYLWGAVIAIASIFPVQQHSIVSSWFPILLLIYPVCKTVFLIYGKLASGVSPDVADALDFHQLI